MERRQRHQVPGSEKKSKAVMYRCLCNNILKVVFLAEVFESGTWGGQPRRALTIKMVTALDGFAFEAPRWKHLELEWVTHTGHRMDSQSRLQKSLTHIHNFCVHTQDAYCISITCLSFLYTSELQQPQTSCKTCLASQSQLSRWKDKLDVLLFVTESSPDLEMWRNLHD